jgi:hypothetical protein
MKLERVRDAIAHKQTDIVPYNIELTSEELAKISEYLGIVKDEFFNWAGIRQGEKLSCRRAEGTSRPRRTRFPPMCLRRTSSRLPRYCNVNPGDAAGAGPPPIN